MQNQKNNKVVSNKNILASLSAMIINKFTTVNPSRLLQELTHAYPYYWRNGANW